MYQEKEIRLVIKGIIPSKKNSKKVIPDWKHRKIRLITDPKIQQWADDVRAQLVGLPKISGAVEMMVVIYNPDLRKRDLDNQLCTINDVLKGIVFDEDDGKVLQQINIGWGGVDKENPRAEVIIRQLTV